jgi:tetratricopeptide (TPR) repeat protein
LALHRFRKAEEIAERLIDLNPDEPSTKILKAQVIFAEKADLKEYLNAFKTVPSLLQDRIDIASERISATVYAREWTNAEDILHRSANEEFYFSYTGATIPRGCLEIWLARLRRDDRAMETRFATARDLLYRNTEAHPDDAELLSALGTIDAALGRKLEATQEARRAAETMPISEDAERGPALVSNLAVVYALTNEPDLAFEELDVSVKTPGGILYGDLKFDPAFDALRKDPRFDKLLAQLAPHD